MSEDETGARMVSKTIAGGSIPPTHANLEDEIKIAQVLDALEKNHPPYLPDGERKNFILWRVRHELIDKCPVPWVRILDEIGSIGTKFTVSCSCGTHADITDYYSW